MIFHLSVNFCFVSFQGSYMSYNPIHSQITNLAIPIQYHTLCHITQTQKDKSYVTTFSLLSTTFTFYQNHIKTLLNRTGILTPNRNSTSKEPNLFALILPDKIRFVVKKT